MKNILLLCLLISPLLMAKPNLSPEVKNLLLEAKKSVSAVTQLELKEMIEKDDDIVLLDVRNPNEWKKNTIKAKNIVKISRGFLEVKYQKLILSKYNKNDNFIVYCALEPRSVFAAKRLKELGFKNVRYLKSGLIGW